MAVAHYSHIVADHRLEVDPVIQPFSPALSEIQRDELIMVRAYLTKRAADFEWESTTSQGLEPSSESNDIPLSTDIVAYRYEVA